MTTKQTKRSDSGFSEAELAAMKERAAELRASKGGNKLAAEAERCVETIEGLPQPDRELAERIHAIVLAEAPQLAAKTWYGFPAYARDGKVVVFFKPASKFETRYATLGFEEAAQLDEGSMWATSFALTAIGKAEEKTIRALVRRAAGS
ncbi:DUF1801 domain-containing protein [Nocardioides anomalus]|uniref:DUF1801 domain-containing protein n=1 Tax=Nocardioides anomalus TaxID=2712223 RepID=A0A6G6WJF4_9ACTN|nr:DUF1801 domain-containing protein [Nocardioides anomalus]QIG45359.1 DUF1801 domain-containing protein [Nocardioides anomalus]